MYAHRPGATGGAHHRGQGRQRTTEILFQLEQQRDVLRLVIYFRRELMVSAPGSQLAPASLQG